MFPLPDKFLQYQDLLISKSQGNTSYTHMSIHFYIYTMCLHMNIPLYIYIYAHIYMNVYTCIGVYTYNVLVCIHVNVNVVCACMYAHLYISTHICTQWNATMHAQSWKCFKTFKFLFFTCALVQQTNNQTKHRAQTGSDNQASYLYFTFFLFSSLSVGLKSQWQLPKCILIYLEFVCYCQMNTRKTASRVFSRTHTGCFHPVCPARLTNRYC